MTNEEIMYGLRKAKEQDPNVTIGRAIEQMMCIDVFYRDMYSFENHSVYANIPDDCGHKVTDIAAVIGSISGMVRANEILLKGMNVDYGKMTEQDLQRLSTPGDIVPIMGSDSETWQLLSSLYVFVNA